MSSSTRELCLRWALALGCVAAVVFCFSPPWNSFLTWSRVPEMGWMFELRRGACVLEQVAHPGAPLADNIHRAIQWRLLFPWIARALSLPAGVTLGLAHVGCLFVLAYVVTLLRRQAAPWRTTAMATLVLGASSWFFTSTGWLGYYDSWLALALLLVAFAQSRGSLWAACLWAPWVDERFIVALPLALGCRYLVSQLLPWRATAAPDATAASAAPSPREPRTFSWLVELVGPLVLAAGFVVIRLGVLADRSAPGATLTGYLASQDFLNAPAWRIALGIWEGLRASWLFVILGVLLLWRSSAITPPAARTRRVLAGLLATGVVLTSAVGLATAQDYSRSMTMVLPAAVFGLLLMVRLLAASTRLLRAAVLVALLLPAHHVVNERVHPIYYLYHELGALRAPPLQATAEYFELCGIRSLDEGNLAQAHLDFTVAIKLARNPAPPAMRRGVLAANHGKWPEALADFSTMVEHDRANPEAWLLRAHAQLELGRVHEARLDFNEALARAPAGWSLRADVTQFMEQLNAAP